MHQRVARVVHVAAAAAAVVAAVFRLAGEGKQRHEQRYTNELNEDAVRGGGGGWMDEEPRNRAGTMTGHSE